MNRNIHSSYPNDDAKHQNDVNNFRHFDKSNRSSMSRGVLNNTPCRYTNTQINMCIDIKRVNTHKRPVINSRYILSRDQNEQFFNHRATGRKPKNSYGKMISGNRVEFIRRSNL